MNDLPTSTERAARSAARAGSPLADLLAAHEAAVMVVGFDRSVIAANEGGLLLFPDGDISAVLELMPERFTATAESGIWRGDIEVDGPQAGTFTAMVHVTHDPTSASGGHIAVLCVDVTEDRRDLAEAIYLLEHDATTGLLNRRGVLALMEAEFTERFPTDVAVIHVDVDRLRDVNEALGHDIGDRLLTSTAQRLTSAVRPGDVVGRGGDDEFIVWCRDVPDADTATELADKLRRALTGRLAIRELELDVSVSVGVAMSDPYLLSQAETDTARAAANQLLRDAETAVHAAKQIGRGRSAYFRPELRRAAADRTELAAALSRALRANELYLEYQPIYSAVSEHAEAAEALLRWHHPTRGRLEAGDFVAVAEETGSIVPIGDWVIGQACATARRWIDAGLVDRRFSVHVNVSSQQLARPAFVERVVGQLRVHRLRPRQIVLEARETTLLGIGTDEVVRSVRALRRVGVRVALDNFGTGSNALSLLTDVGADVLKLDGGLALPAGASEADIGVVRSLVLLAHALNMEVVAERVSALEQLRRLRAAGCDLVQGHLLGRPGAPEEFAFHMEL